MLYGQIVAMGRNCDLFPVLMIAVTFILVLGFSVQPLFLRRELREDNGRPIKEVLELKKQAIYDQIKELELEHEMGTILPADFQRNRNELKLEVSAIMDQLKSLGSKPISD